MLVGSRFQRAVQSFPARDGRLDRRSWWRHHQVAWAWRQLQARHTWRGHAQPQWSAPGHILARVLRV